MPAAQPAEGKWPPQFYHAPESSSSQRKAKDQKEKTLVTVTVSAQPSSWPWCKGQIVGKTLSVAGNTAPCTWSPAAANQISLIITHPWWLFPKGASRRLGCFPAHGTAHCLLKSPSVVWAESGTFLQVLGAVSARGTCLGHVSTAAPGWQGAGDDLLPPPLPLLSCLRARGLIILQWFQITQLEIALKVQNMASALLGAVCFQSEGEPHVSAT